MEKLEELLPGIDKFLKTTLAKESLSKLAEKQRQYYVERLDIIQLPPHLPPKPDGGEKTQMQGRKLPEPVRTKSSEDFIAHQRAISRQTLSGQELPLQSGTCEDNPVPNDGLGIDSDQFDDGLYEEPVPMDSNLADAHNYLPSAPAATFNMDSDADSSTSYESYGEPDQEDAYNNVGHDGQLKTDIPLPRLKTKRKKKTTSVHDRYYKQLISIIHEGELYHRDRTAFTTAWTKRYCAICDGIFYVYKDNKESRPIVSLPLLGYDIILQDKEKGRSNVLRLSHPGCTTHFISTDSASETQGWMNKIEVLCYAPSTTDATDDTKSNDRTGSISSMETYMESPGGAMMNGSPGMKNRKVRSTLSSDGKREKKGKIGKFLSETFGKKKGRAAAHHLEITGGALLDRNSLSSPDTSIAGLVKMSSPAFLNDDLWQYRHCAIRHGVFECFKDDSTSSDLEFSLALADYELSAPDDKNSLELTIARQGDTAFIIEPENKLDQGDWLSAMLKHVSNGGVHPLPDNVEQEDNMEDLTYTYVDSSSFGAGSGPSAPLEDNGTAKSQDDPASSEDERQYADLSDDKESDHESAGEGEGDTYDEPPVEDGDRLSKVYEEVADTASPTDSRTNSYRSSTGSASEVADGSVAQAKNESQSSAANQKLPATGSTGSPSVGRNAADWDRQTRGDMQTKADLVASPTLSSESNRPSFSRESSCSSEGSSRSKLSETIAKNRALFENNSSTPSSGPGPKWTGHKLAGTNNSSPSVKRTPSLSSTASTRSTPNSAASSPKTSRANLAIAGNVDRFKAAFESNNNTIVDKQQSPSPNTQRKGQSDDAKALAGAGKKAAGTISPIMLSADREDSKPPPKFTAMFTTQTTVQVNNNKPRKLEIKSVTPSPYTNPTSGGDSNGSDSGRLGIDPILRFDIDLTSKDKSVTLGNDGRAVSSASSASRKSSTLPASSSPRATLSNTSLSATSSPRTLDQLLPAASSPNTTRANAKNFLSSALQKFTADEGASKPVSSYSSNGGYVGHGTEESEQRRLNQLRQKLTSLRKDRQKVRDQKLSTMLPEHIEKLNAEYKRIDVEYKATHKEIEVLEERKVQRIKDPSVDSIEKRRAEAEKNSVIGRKKLWETNS